MQRFTISIRQSAASSNWLSALFLALAMPDICGRLETPNEYVGVRYKRWFNDNLKAKYHDETRPRLKSAADFAKVWRVTEEDAKARLAEYDFRDPYLTADDCWNLRCRFHHDGYSDTQGRKASPSDRDVHFTFPDPRIKIGIVFSGPIVAIPANRFCEDICAAVDLWNERVAGDTDIQARMADLLDVYPLDSAKFLLVQFPETPPGGRNP